MKKVLLTNAYISGYSGSELDTIEIANYFLNKGYNVDIFTLKVSKPLINEINKNIRVITMNNIENLYEKYDILWAHHYPLVDFLLFSTKVKFDYIHYVCLSSIEPLEQIPMYYENFNLTSVMSYNTKLKLIKENPGYKEEKIAIFPNYSLKSYFNHPAKNYRKISNIAIVSNHIPSELLETVDMLKKDKIIVDIYGINYNYLKVDKDVLSKYDLVISMGKTCFYSLAMGIPTYVYDRFGGVGYVTKENIQKIFQGNFVCIDDSKKYNKDELYFDIVNNYSFSKNDSSYFQKFGIRNFCFEKNMQLTLEKLFNTKKFSNNILDQKYLFIKKTASLYTEKISEYEKEINILKEKLIDKKTKCQIFYTLNNENFSEEKSIKKISYCIKNNKYEVEFTIDDDYDKLRFDICEKNFIIFTKFRINGEKITFNQFNMVMIDGKLVSSNNDPYIIFDKRNNWGRKIKITYCLDDYLVDDVYLMMLKKNYTEEKLNLITNGKFFKLYSKIKKILENLKIIKNND